MPTRKKTDNVAGDFKYISDAFSAFIALKFAQGKSQSTLKNYIQTYDLYLKHNGFTDETPLAAFTRASVLNWTLEMRQHKPITTINHYIKDLRVFKNFLVSEGFIADFELDTLPNQEEQIKLYSDADIEKLLSPPKNPDNYAEVRMWVIVNLICACGVRRGSIVSLKVGDVDFDTGFIAFPHTKNKKYLRLPMSSALIPVLKTYIKEWRHGCDDNDPLFPAVSDEPIGGDGLGKAFRRYCNQRGVKRASLHGLRHNFARNFILTGGQPYVLMTILGHSSFEMTKKYIRLFGDDLKVGFDEHSLLDKKQKVAANHKVVGRYRG